MTVYLDMVFFINLLYQLGILYITGLLFRMKREIFRMAAASALGSACYCIMIVMGLPVTKFPGNLLAGAVLGVFSGVAAFYPVARKKLLGVLLCEAALSFCLSGILDLWGEEVKDGYLMLTSSAALVFLGLFCIKMKRLLFERIQEEKSILRVRLYHKGRMADTYGLVDTGNGLVDPISKEPVIIIQKSLSEKLLLKEGIGEQRGYRVIPYGSIGRKKGILEAFRMERLEILKERENGKDEAVIREKVLCAVYEENYSNNSYEVILTPLLL